MLFFVKKSNHYEQLSKKLSSILVRRLSPDEFYLQILKFFAEALEAEGAVLVLKEKENFVVRHCLDGRSFSLRTEGCAGFFQWLQKNHETVVRQQLLEEPRFGAVKTSGLNFLVQFHAEACLPLFADDTLLGLVVLGPKKKGRPYTPACRVLLDWLGHQVCMALQNARLQEQIRLQSFDLVGVKDLKSQIIANLSHELRTPLTGIIGFAELLSEEIDGPLTPGQRSHIEQVLGNGNRLMKILTALVDLSKLEAGNLPMHVQQFHLSPLVASLGDEIPLGSETRLCVDIDSATPRIYGDLNLVRQVFKNLLDNAAKYTPRGEVEVTAFKKGEMLEICVADTGIGIPEEKLERIFDGFYQVDGGLTRDFQGTGIGLALSKKLIELHGGRLWAKSAQGKGSRFYFTLPLKPIAIRCRELAA